jgi:hypothetical protein
MSEKKKTFSEVQISKSIDVKYSITRSVSEANTYSI